MSSPTTLALSRLTGRPVAPSSAVALQVPGSVAAAAASPAAKVPAGLERIIRPQAAVRWMMPQLSAITPQYIEGVLRGAFAGGHLQQWELFDLMEDTWPRLAKNLNEVKRAVVSMDWKIEPWAEEDTPPTDSAKERAKLVSSALWRMMPDPAADENGFEQTIYDVLDAHAKGTSVLEINWHIRNAGSLGDITAPRATSWVHPVCYAWSQEGRLGLRVPMLDGQGNATMRLPTTSGLPGRNELMDFPEDKFLIAISKAKTSSAQQAALLRGLAWWWCAANFSSDWLMNLAQIFGLPFRWANYSSGSSQATINAISGMLENMGSAGWAAFPEGTTLELKEAGNLGSMSPQADLLDRADKNCDLLILGQTLTSDTGGMGGGGGSLALGKVHAGVKEQIIEAAANFAAEIINRQLVPAILRQNYGDDLECPEFYPQSSDDGNVAAMMESLGTAVRAGVITPSRDDEESLRKSLNLPPMSKDVEREWKKQGGARAPITLQQEGAGLTTGPFGRPQAPAPSPGGEGRGEGGPPADKAEPGGEEEPTQAKGRPPARGDTDLSRLASAFAADLQPLRDRLARIIEIEDPEILRAKLGAFVQSLPKLLRDINADPESARVLEDEMRAGLVQIIQRK